jgi:hypothetical protein
MAKYIYVGDPKGGPCSAGVVSYKGPNGESVSFPVGEAVEAPEWIESRLKRNTHFKAVQVEAEKKPASKKPAEGKAEGEK